MGQRIAAVAWHEFKKQFPDDIEKMTTFDVSLDQYNLFLPRIRRKPSKYSKKAEDKSNIEMFGIELGPMIDWLNENTNDQYYAEVAEKKRGVRAIRIKFYFMDEGDAMAFKLMFFEKDLTNE